MDNTKTQENTKSGQKSNSKAKSPKPKFPKETYLFWYENMLLQRKFEEKAGQMYQRQKIRGFCHLYIGQEASASGAVTALKEGDKWITAYRDHGQPLALGVSPREIMAELFAKATGVLKEKGDPCTCSSRRKIFWVGTAL